MRRRRPNTAAAPAPNSSIIGGAGTLVPLVVLVVLPLLDEVELLVLDELELLELVELDEPEVLDDEDEVDPQCLWQ